VVSGECVGAVTAVGSLADLLGRSGVVSVHVSLADTTRGLIDCAALALMKSSALLVSTARRQIVDSGALAEALATGNWPARVRAMAPDPASTKVSRPWPAGSGTELITVAT
jgi:phosphoglycerate dehydrogenase-like enzyme